MCRGEQVGDTPSIPSRHAPEVRQSTSRERCRHSAPANTFKQDASFRPNSRHPRHRDRGDRSHMTGRSAMGPRKRCPHRKDTLTRPEHDPCWLLWYPESRSHWGDGAVHWPSKARDGRGRRIKLGNPGSGRLERVHDKSDWSCTTKLE